MLRGDAYFGSNMDRILDVLLALPPQRLLKAQGHLSAEDRLYLREHGGLPLPKIPAPARAVEITPRIAGQARGPLVILREKIPTVDALRLIPADSIVAMEFLPTSDMRVGPFRGIITFAQEGETSHAQARARLWGIPHAVWPGSEALEALEGHDVVLSVTSQSASVVAAASREPKPPKSAPIEVELPRAETASKIYLARGDPDLRRPELVGHKVAELNEFAAQGVAVEDPDIQVAFGAGAAFTFGAFLHFLDGSEYSRGDYDSALSKLRSISAKSGFRYALRRIWRRFFGTGWMETWVPSLLKRLQQAIGEASSKPWYYVEDLEDLLAGGVFVRGSTNAEDLPGFPGLGAGINKTVANVRTQREFWKAVTEVFSAIWSEKAFWERQAFVRDQSRLMPAVWLVPAKKGEYAFVLHTSQASLGRQDLAVLEVVQGLGESLVGGDPQFAGLPSRLLIDKKSGNIMERRAGTKANRSVLAQGGGVIAEPVEPALEFAANPAADRLARAFNAVAARAEAVFHGSR